MVLSNQYSSPIHFVEKEARKVFGPPTLNPATPKYPPQAQVVKAYQIPKLKLVLQVKNNRTMTVKRGIK